MNKEQYFISLKNLRYNDVKNEIISDLKFIEDVPYKLVLQKNENIIDGRKCFKVNLKCDGPYNLKNWSYDIRACFTIYSYKRHIKNTRIEHTFTNFDDSKEITYYMKTFNCEDGSIVLEENQPITIAVSIRPQLFNQVVADKRKAKKPKPAIIKSIGQSDTIVNNSPGTKLIGEKRLKLSLDEQRTSKASIIKLESRRESDSPCFLEEKKPITAQENNFTHDRNNNIQEYSSNVDMIAYENQDELVSDVDNDIDEHESEVRINDELNTQIEMLKRELQISNMISSRHIDRQAKEIEDLSRQVSSLQKVREKALKKIGSLIMELQDAKDQVVKCRCQTKFAL